MSDLSDYNFLFISFKTLTMKSNYSVFSFSDWGSTQSTNKKAEEIAWIYFTNILRLYTVQDLRCLAHLLQ
jgi:hypothetical protein